MLETLSLGGGIVSIKPAFDDPDFQDFGFCHDLKISIEYEQTFRQKYIRAIGSKVTKAKSSDGSIETVSMSGSFLCESITRERLSTLWFRGENTTAGTELLQLNTLTPLISGFKFISVPATGPRMCLKIPKMEFSIDGELEMIMYDWKIINFVFEAIIEEGFMPTLRVEEEGEDHEPFCV